MHFDRLIKLFLKMSEHCLNPDFQDFRIDRISVQPSGVLKCQFYKTGSAQILKIL